MTLLPHTSSPSVQIRDGIGMAVSKSGLRVHERLALPNCTVSLPMLQFALKNAPEGYSVRLTSTRLEFEAPGFSAKVPLVDEPELSEPEKHADSAKVDFGILKRLSACALPNPGRLELEHVHVSGGICAGSNGRMLATEEIDCPLKFEVHSSVFPMLEAKTYEVSVGEKSVRINLDEGCIWTPRPASDFDVALKGRSLTETIEGESAAIRSDDVVSVLRSASQVAESVELEFKPDRIVIHTPDSASYFSKDIIGKPSGTSVVRLNPKYMLAALNAVGDEFVDLFVTERSAFVKGAKCRAICMGMKRT